MTCNDDCPVLDFALYRGDSKDFAIRVEESVGGVVSPDPLTGATIVLTAKYQLSDADPGVFRVSTTSGDITIRAIPNDHICDVIIPPSATSPITQDSIVVYDVVARWSATKEKTILRGTISVSLRVTTTVP